MHIFVCLEKKHVNPAKILHESDDGRLYFIYKTNVSRNWI